MNQHYQTPYHKDVTFGDKLKKSDQIVRGHFVPALEQAGFGLSPLSADTEVFRLSESQRQHWIDPLSATNGEVRPPDLRSLGNKFISINGSDCKSADFEVKDYPQENIHLMTGVPFRMVRKYLAWQHLTETPVFLLFRDTELQESGGENFKDYAYTSAFRENGELVPYGGLICDLQVAHRRSYVKQRNGKCEIRWTAQNDRDGSTPMMKTIPQMAELLASGKIRKVKGDPMALPLWRLIQEKSKEEAFGPPLLKPDGGLVYFTAFSEEERPNSP